MSRHPQEPIPVAPFLAWCSGRAEMLSREHGYGGRDGATERLILELGWPVESGGRRLHRWRNPQQGEGHNGLAERGLIEDALEHAGERFFDVYPDLEESAVDYGYCVGCHDDVATSDGKCLWCCAETVAARPRNSARRAGQGRYLTDAQVRAAHRIYEERGLRIVDLADLLWERYGYANRSACASCLARAFGQLGLPKMDRLTAARRAALKHGMCVGGVTTPEYLALRRAQAREARGVCGHPLGDGRGGACGYLRAPGAETCRLHDPERLAARRALLLSVRWAGAAGRVAA